MSFSQVFIHRRIATTLLAMGLGLAGVVAYFLCRFASTSTSPPSR
jgi:multidrug efflux pump subunit AcrB